MRIASFALPLLAAACLEVSAATLDVRGRLTNAAGQPESGSCLLRFKLFDVAPGSPEVWNDSQYVSLVNGEFQALLGKGRSIPARLLTDGYRLGIETPAGTGWKAVASSVAPTAGAEPKPSRASASAGEPRRPAAQPEDPKLSAVRRLKAQVADAPPAKAPPVAAADPAVHAVKRDEVPPSPSQTREESDRLKARLEALEKKLQPGPREFRAKVYEVQNGDTLQSVAAKIWGDPGRWADLYNANADRILRGGDIRAGQRLMVPEVGR